MSVMVNGFLLREAIRRWELRRDTAATQFESSVSKFEDEEKASPDELAKEFVTAETAIGKLQAIQTAYNLYVTIAVGDTRMTLCEAVKRLGGAGRLDKMWRVLCGEKKDKYDLRNEMTRRADEVRAVRVVSVREAMSRASAAAKFASTLRAAIAKGNGEDVALSGLENRTGLSGTASLLE